jgi:predicted nucleic acid-binding protein
MRDFLIDTNIWGYWFNENTDPEHSNVLKRVNTLKEQCEKTNSSFRTWISSVTWGEIEYGYRSQIDKSASREEQFRKFLQDVGPKEFIIDKHVASEYGKIRAIAFEKFGPNDKKTKYRRPEQLIDPITGRELGIDENDLWLAAQAITYDLILVTNDKFKRIREIAGDELHIENWAEGNA